MCCHYRAYDLYSQLSADAADEPLVQSCMVYLAKPADSSQSNMNRGTTG